MPPQISLTSLSPPLHPLSFHCYPFAQPKLLSFTYFWLCLSARAEAQSFSLLCPDKNNCNHKHLTLTVSPPWLFLPFPILHFIKKTPIPAECVQGGLHDSWVRVWRESAWPTDLSRNAEAHDGVIQAGAQTQRSGQMSLTLQPHTDSFVHL